MRELSLHHDIEHEVWAILKELMDDHGMSLKDAVEATSAATHRAMASIQEDLQDDVLEAING